MFCSACGTQFAASERFCTACGSPRIGSTPARSGQRLPKERGPARQAQTLVTVARGLAFGASGFIVFIAVIQTILRRGSLPEFLGIGLASLLSLVIGYRSKTSQVQYTAAITGVMALSALYVITTPSQEAPLYQSSFRAALFVIATPRWWVPIAVLLALGSVTVGIISIARSGWTGFEPDPEMARAVTPFALVLVGAGAFTQVYLPRFYSYRPTYFLDGWVTTAFSVVFYLALFLILTLAPYVGAEAARRVWRTVALFAIFSAVVNFYGFDLAGIEKTIAIGLYAAGAFVLLRLAGRARSVALLAIYSAVAILYVYAVAGIETAIAIGLYAAGAFGLLRLAGRVADGRTGARSAVDQSDWVRALRFAILAGCLGAMVIVPLTRLTHGYTTYGSDYRYYSEYYDEVRNDGLAIHECGAPPAVMVRPNNPGVLMEEDRDFGSKDIRGGPPCNAAATQRVVSAVVTTVVLLLLAIAGWVASPFIIDGVTRIRSRRQNAVPTGT